MNKIIVIFLFALVFVAVIVTGVIKVHFEMSDVPVKENTKPVKEVKNTTEQDVSMMTPDIAVFYYYKEHLEADRLAHKIQ